MPKTHTEAWDDIMRRAKAAGISVPFNHAGVAVLLLPPEASPPAAASQPASQDPAAVSATPGAPSSSAT